MYNKYLSSSKDILKSLAEYKDSTTAKIKAIREDETYNDTYKNKAIAELETQTQSKIVNEVAKIKGFMQEWNNEQNNMTFDLDFVSKLTPVMQQIPLNTLYDLVGKYRGNFAMVDTLYFIALKQQEKQYKENIKENADFNYAKFTSNIIESYKLKYEKVGMPPVIYELQEYLETLNTKLDMLATNKSTESQVLELLNIAQVAMGCEKWEYFNSQGFNFNFKAAREKNIEVEKAQQKAKTDTFNFSFNK